MDMYRLIMLFIIVFLFTWFIFMPFIAWLHLTLDGMFWRALERRDYSKEAYKRYRREYVK